MTSPRTEFDDDATGGLGSITVMHPPGAFTPSQASRVALQTVGRHRDLLSGIGVDWGCGTGLLAIASARLATVDMAWGLDANPTNVWVAGENSALNRTESKTTFHLADSMTPVDPEPRAKLDRLRGSLGFILANPPASTGDDGFGYRRRVMNEVASYLRPGGMVMLNVSSQYGTERVEALTLEPGWVYVGVLESTEPVPFDLGLPVMLGYVTDYAAEEARGGLQYRFEEPDGVALTATAALDRYRSTGESPHTRWQVHGFRKEST